MNTAKSPEPQMSRGSELPITSMSVLDPRRTNVVRGVVLFTAALTAGFTSIADGSVLPGMALVGAGLIYVLPTAISRSLQEHDSRHAVAVTATDVLLITAIVWSTGSMSSEYYLLYYLPVANAALRLNARDGIAAAVLGGSCYALLSLLDRATPTVVTASLYRVFGVCVSAVVMVIFLALLKREGDLRAGLRSSLHDSLRRVAAVYDVARAASTGADLKSVLSTILEQAARFTAASAGSIALLESSGKLRHMASLNPEEGDGGQLDCTSDDARQALTTVSPIVIQPSSTDQGRSAGDNSVSVYIPLTTPSGPLGVLGLASERGRKFGAGHVDFLKTLCSEAALAIENAQLRLELRRMATTDPLTGLLNRREVEGRLTEEVSRANRHSRALAILMIDVDDLKAVNDRHGHAAGDDVLVALGDILRSSTRASDIAGRIGGDEFLVLLPETDAAGAATVAERLVATFRNSLLGSAQSKEVAGETSISVGIASGEEGPLTAAQLLSRADAALYHAKRAGKNRAHRAEAPRELARARADG
jgi:diguanylate cyclase (GGDEF)-like protein